MDTMEPFKLVPMQEFKSYWKTNPENFFLKGINEKLAFSLLSDNTAIKKQLRKMFPLEKFAF